MPRGAPTLVASDTTPLLGPRIDVAARIGWLLRTARRTRGDDAPSMQAMADRNGITLARLQRIETGATRSGLVATDYERALDLPTGSLRAPIDIVCRGFAYSPRERDPDPAVTSFREVSRRTDVVSGDRPSGGEWLAWARPLAQPGAIGMHADQVTTLTDRLVGELNRAVGTAFTTRYDAVSLLRAGDYGDSVIEVARARLADPHVQVLLDMMSAVGERATPDAVDWCLELLWNDRPRVVTGAVLALENMAETSGDPAFWLGVLGAVVARYDALHDAEVDEWTWLSHLIRLVPRQDVAATGWKPARPLAPASSEPANGNGNGNGETQARHWEESSRIADAVTSSFEQPAQPMLARLVYEIAFGPFETRAVTAGMLLTGLPGWSAAVAEQVTAVVDHDPDPVVRARAGRRLIELVHDAPPTAVPRWTASDEPGLRDVGLRLAGNAGVLLPVDTLRRAATEGAAAPVTYAAGMAAHPYLDVLAQGSDPDLAGVARWWQREGSRVTDRP